MFRNGEESRTGWRVRVDGRVLGLIWGDDERGYAALRFRCRGLGRFSSRREARAWIAEGSA